MLATLKEWHLDEPITSQRGARFLPLKCHGCLITTHLGTKDLPVRSPFGASNYGDENSIRKTLEFTLEPEQAQEWAEVTKWAREYLLTHSQRLFKKTISKESIAENFRAPVQQKNDYKPLLRCKITTAGPNACRCWNQVGERVDLPEDLRNVPVAAKLAVERVWLMSKEMGLVLTITDLQLCEDPVSCPFRNDCPF